jgi:hypothetical protein
MKAFYTSLLFVSLGVFSFVGCHDTEAKGLFKNSPSTAVTLLYDNTNVMGAKPNITEILELFNFNNEDIYNGYSLQIRLLSTINLTNVSKISIQAQNKLTGEQLKRVADIKQFRSKIANLISEIGKEKIQDEGSSVIYRTLAEELNNLAENKSEEKTVVVYSDMTENSADGNFYQTESIKELKSNPQAVIKRLQQTQPLKNLHGIKVYVVFKPRSYSEEQRFSAIMNMYRIMLEAKGATVKVAANLITE